MREYRLDPAGLAKRKRAVSIPILAAIAGGTLVGLGVPLIFGRAPSSPLVWIGPLVIVSALAAYRVRKVHVQLTKQWESFSVAIDEEALLVRDPNGVDYRVNRNEILELAKHPGQGLVVHSRGNPPLLLPELLLDYPELEAQILSSRPLGTREDLEQRRQRGNRNVMAATYLMLGCWIGSGFAPIAIVPLLAIATIGLAVYVLRTFKALALPEQFMRSVRWAFAFIVLGPIARLCFEALNTGLG